MYGSPRILQWTVYAGKVTKRVVWLLLLRLFLFLFLICYLVEDEKWPEAGEEAYLAEDLEVGRRVEGVDPVELESAEVQHLEHQHSSIKIKNTQFTLKADFYPTISEKGKKILWWKK